MKNKKWLIEVDYLRTISVLLLVLDHTFIIYTGGWKLPTGIQDVNVYFWLGNFFMCIMLPLYVFVSGYTYSNQITEAQKCQSLKKMIIRKFKRLMLPCWIFSLLHIIIFAEFDRINSLSGVVQLLLTGVAHLWFLPMLFYCFIIAHICRYLINKKILNRYSLCILTIAASILTLNVKVTIIGGTLYYFTFFYIGHICFIRKDYVLRYIPPLTILAFFIINFIIVTQIQEQITFLRSGPLIQKLCYQWSNHLIALPMILSGICIAYQLCCKLMKIKLFQTPIHKIAQYSFGIYIIHHFILEVLYYHSPMPRILGSYWLPIISFTIAFTTSYILTLSAKKIPVIQNII